MSTCYWVGPGSKAGCDKIKSMAKTFFFYDLETSGLSPRYDRVMQFAGQRTDMDLNPVGEPYNILVKLSDDILPSPEALLVTGITPQQTVNDGITEAEFAKLLNDEIFIPNTITVGFNSVRFDDEFIRHIMWRNFYDPYEWHWSDGRGRWDLLDVVRLVRALRPDGIKWPVDQKGNPTNRLELLSKANKLDHTKAHDALSDVEALISITKLIRQKQPKIYDYLFGVKAKKEVAELVNLDDPKPFVYASGRYNADFEKTTVVLPIAPGKNPGSVLVYDLRVNPDDFADMDREAILKNLTTGYQERQKDGFRPIPVKELQYNRCPAVAPLGVLDDESQKRIKLATGEIEENFQKLLKNQGLVDKISAAWANRPDFPPAPDVEGQLYDSFTPDADKARIAAVRSAGPDDLADFHPDFIDERLPELLFRYKARNFPQSLGESESKKWEDHRVTKLQQELPGYINRLAQLASENNDQKAQYVLEEIQLWVESICPVE